MLILRARHNRKGNLKRLDVANVVEEGTDYHEAVGDLRPGDYKALHGGSSVVDLTVEREPVVLQHVTVDGTTTTTELPA